jgi:hypothetical protein
VSEFDADPNEIDILAEALHPWDEVGTGHTGSARATLRLAEATTGPRADKQDADEHGDDDGGWWRLEFVLQSMADPSLLVPASQAWADDGSLSRWLSARRNCCWPNSAGPAGSIPSWPMACTSRSPARSNWALELGARTGR